MSSDFDNNTLMSAISYFKHVTRLGNDSLEFLEINESLSVFGMRHVNLLKHSLFQMNRMFNVIEYLASADSSWEEQKIETFDIERLLDEIVNRFYLTVSDYTEVNIDWQATLKGSYSIDINKSKFELAILNLLYCCLKKNPDIKSRPLKIHISATENKERIVFHVRDNKKPLSQDIIDSINDLSVPSLEEISDQSFKTLVSLSLRVAYKSVREMGGELTYTPLKSGNRFDISLPKFVPQARMSFRSPSHYTPTYSYYNEVFADVILEEVIKTINELVKITQ